MKKYLLLAAAMVAFVPIAKAGYDFTLERIEDMTAETVTALDSTYLIPVYDTTNGDADVIAASDLPGVGSGATKAEIDAATDLSASSETVAATNALAQSECGKTMFLSHATEFATTFPAPLAGCKFKFIVANAPETASYTIVSSGGADIIHVHVNELETDTGDDGPWDDNADVVTFVDSLSVVGDWLECVSDGTGWYCNGQVQADGALTSGTT